MGMSPVLLIPRSSGYIVRDGFGTGVHFSQAPTAWRTDFATWSLDARWLWSTAEPFALDDPIIAALPDVIIAGGVGWSRGRYPSGMASVAAGNNALYLDSAPAAAGTTNGVGWVVGEWGTHNLVFDGNSLTAGSGATTGNDYPSQCWRLLESIHWLKSNYAVGGQQIAAMIADFSTQIAPLYDATLGHNILVAWEGTNALFYGQTATQTYNALKTYGQAAVDVGYEVVLLTILPRSDAGTPAGFETARASVNGSLRADFDVATTAARVFRPATGVTYATLLVDVAANGTIGDAGDEESATYYADLVHMTDAGYALIAADVAAALNILSTRTSPYITGISPSALKQNETADITITGTGFAATDIVDFGTGVTVNSLTCVSSAELTANVTVDDQATVGTRHLTLTSNGAITRYYSCLTLNYGYLLLDQFTTDDEAPLTTPRACEPGPGTFTATETDGTFAITGGKLAYTAQATAVFGDQCIVGGAIARAAGQCVLLDSVVTTIGAGYLFGLNKNADGTNTAAYSAQDYSGGVFVGENGNARNVDVSPNANTTYLFSLRAAGYHFLRTVSGQTELLWVSAVESDAARYPFFSNYTHAGTIDNFRAPTQLWSPTPLVSDSFSRADSDTIGASAGGACEEAGGTGIASTEIAGDWDIASGQLVTAGASPGDSGWIITWAAANVAVVVQCRVTLQTNSIAGVILASNGTTWYRVALDQAANAIRIYWWDGAAYTQLATTNVTVNAGTAYDLLVVRDTNDVHGFVGTSRVTYASSTENGLATAHGLCSTTAGDAFDNVVIWPRVHTLPAF